MAFEIDITDVATEELKAIRTFDRRRIVDGIKQQLSDQPTIASRNRKCLKDTIPSFEHRQPLWELRVGDYRVFYDVDEENQNVTVRAVRLKEPDQTTEDIIQ
jgi:mRNA-degrading endonuclease RelE of RelBE toxin-antitoxin system